MHLDTTGSKVGTSLGPTQGRPPPQQRNPSELEGTLQGGQLAQNPESPQEAP